MTKVKKRMSADEWAAVRAKWEHDPRDGYTWIVSEMGLGLSHVAVLKRARKEGWAKKASLKTIVERAQAQADASIVGAKVTETGAKVTEKVTTVTSAEAVDLRADVIGTHRREWREHRETFTLESMLSGEDGGLNASKVAKAAAEVIKIRQEGERKAWGLDAIAEDTTAGVSTLSELDAMFAIAMKRSDEMREAVRKERGVAGGHAAD